MRELSSGKEILAAETQIGDLHQHVWLALACLMLRPSSFVNLACMFPEESCRLVHMSRIEEPGNSSLPQGIHDNQ